MQLQAIPAGTPVLVEWVDAEGHDGWTKNDEFDHTMLQPLKPVETVGLFHQYVAGSHITILGSRSATQSMHGLAIPLGWLREVHILGIDAEQKVEITCQPQDAATSQAP